MLHHSTGGSACNKSRVAIETMGPPITLAGCHNGLPDMENSNTQLAPGGAISQELRVIWLSRATVVIASRPPMPAFSTSAKH